MKPNSRTRAERIVAPAYGDIELRFPDGAVVTIPVGGASDAVRARMVSEIRSALAAEFRAVRRQARQAVRRELLAEIRKAHSTCDVNDAWSMGVVAGLEAAAEMAKGKVKR